MYADSLSCARVKQGESEQFRIDSEVGFSVIAVMKESSEIPGPGFLYADKLVPCGESEEDLRAMVGRLVEVCRRRE